MENVDEIRPEDCLRLVLLNIRKWKSVDVIEDNIRTMLVAFDDHRFSLLHSSFHLS
jgi:hypothetical protein